jgi:hypothetical protein
LKRLKLSILALIAVFLTAGVLAAGQTSVTTADLDRLEDQLQDATAAVGQVRSRDVSLSAQLQDELEEARDDVTYLRVKVRRNEPVGRGEYLDLRDRIDDIRTRARGDATSPRYDSVESSGDVIPVGTEFDVRLQTALSSATAKPEDRFTATTLVDLRRGGAVLIPAGSVARGIVSSVDPAGHLDRRARMTVTFDQITVNGRSYPMRATVTKAIESGLGDEAGKIGAGAGVGAIIGGIIGGARGALAGILIGGGGVIAATEGDDVELPVGTVLQIRLDSPLEVLER